MRKENFLLEIGSKIMRLPKELKQKRDRMDSARETAEVMSDPELMAQLRQSIQEADDEKLVAWEDVKLEMGYKP